MARNESSLDRAASLVTDLGLTDEQARAYAARELLGLPRDVAARELDKEPSTLDTLHQRAKDNLRLPNVSSIDIKQAVKEGHGKAVEITFETGGRLRYTWVGDEVHEEYIRAGETSTYYITEFPEADEEDDVYEWAMTTLEVYFNDFSSVEQLREDWSDLFDALFAA